MSEHRDDPGAPGGTADRPAVFFRDAAEFRAWLERHHATETELWMEVRRAHAPDRGLTWADAVLEALCFGWIDSVSQPIDEDRRRQRWTPRKPRSIWSRVNIAHAERLIAEGRMRPAGLAAFERRAPERTGVYSHENGETELDAHLRGIVEGSPATTAFLAEAAPGYRKAVWHWIMSAAQDATRERRARQLVADSEAGRLVPPQRPGRTPAWLPRAAAAARAAGPGAGGAGDAGARD
ncbi:YdeI family protein [Microbacterium sp. Marseille-Q6965]|uniref:YdeI/OmpD-associated family protein n=1 Tax=Microbacterium sp. Marseille-Q6965 TaxID=2965072 RepID=UPI0021B75D17|nr:YdeI/OmpD-associated family protein [Microbacterium sp. Marseille-Q6965]